jgi:predicted ABC-type ATPase
MPAALFVLAGVNGSGKSSIGGAALKARGVEHFDPDRFARELRHADPGLTAEAANARAWTRGRRGLEEALSRGSTFAFETTLGARTIPALLLAGARAGARVHVWFVGLTSPELHLQRVRDRVLAGGHDIPEERIRARFDTSRTNLIRLLPVLTSLRVYDNSFEADPKAGLRPQPLPLLHMEAGRIVANAPLPEVPEWAKPILAAAFARHGASP